VAVCSGHCLKVPGSKPQHRVKPTTLPADLSALEAGHPGKEFMKILSMDPAKAHAVGIYGSQAFTLTHIAAGNARLSHAVLAPGGCIGRHPATQQQLLLVIDGDGEVSGDNGVFHPLAAGQAALWQPGEEHETRSEMGLTAVIFEGEIERLSEQLEETSPDVL
jgi:hypothetical protein